MMKVGALPVSNAFHFQSQLSDGSIIAEEYYNQNNDGFGAYVKLPPAVPACQRQRSFFLGWKPWPRATMTLSFIWSMMQTTTS